MGAVDVDGLTGKQWAEHVNGLDEPLDPRPTLVESDACSVVLGLHVARAESQLESATRDGGNGRRFARRLDGMAKVVVEHQCSGVQA